jgi:hypothetical protein
MVTRTCETKRGVEMEIGSRRETVSDRPDPFWTGSADNQVPTESGGILVAGQGRRQVPARGLASDKSLPTRASDPSGIRTGRQALTKAIPEEVRRSPRSWQAGGKTMRPVLAAQSKSGRGYDDLGDVNACYFVPRDRPPTSLSSSWSRVGLRFRLRRAPPIQILTSLSTPTAASSIIPNATPR